MNPITFSNITLKDFVQGSLDGEDKQGIDEMLRAMQRGAFEILWNRCKTGIAITLYSNIGQAQNAVMPESMKYSAALARVKNKPIIGMVRSATIHGDDFRFIALVHDNKICLLLENSANDSKLAQVWMYDKEGELFVPSPGYKLINFLIYTEVSVKP